MNEPIQFKNYVVGFKILVTPENKEELDLWMKRAARARYKREHRMTRMMRRMFK